MTSSHQHITSPPLEASPNRFDWPLANQAMAKSLAFAGYDYKFVYGHGFHSGRHGTAILPDSLRWLWRDYKPSGK